MLSKRDYKARLLATGTTSQKVAELIGAAIGEPVARYELARCFDYKCDSGKVSRIRAEADRITAKLVRHRENEEKEDVIDALKREGVLTPDKDVTIFLGDYSWGATVFVFIGGEFYGIRNPETGKWRMRKDG